MASLAMPDFHAGPYERAVNGRCTGCKMVPAEGLEPPTP